MKLWLDDVRDLSHAPSFMQDAEWVKTVDWAKDYFAYALATFSGAGQSDPITHASLDHDLGTGAPGGDGIELVKWMVKKDVWPTHGIAVHSGNWIGKTNMLSLIDQYGPYKKHDELYRLGYRGDWLGYHFERSTDVPYVPVPKHKQ